MRKKLDTRFPAARIKKIMQADEDVGKIALAVPVLVSKALELFLQDLCDRTYEITLQRGAKTMNSLHLTNWEGINKQNGSNGKANSCTWCTRAGKTPAKMHMNM
ncbi:Dr1-associated corepressor [Glycine soja]|uniref:Dr1-associated corepressor n=1 Tax=Glycine soja TaxID=3848 RepID=A0A0B2PUJ1_GLYSO|nr:Dr1-associated corepressor [Glycine soja]